MLVLSRTSGEEITIGDDITVTVIEIRGHKIRLGITAPRSLQVDRAEIRKLKDSESLRLQSNDNPSSPGPV